MQYNKIRPIRKKYFLYLILNCNYSSLQQTVGTHATIPVYSKLLAPMLLFLFTANCWHPCYYSSLQQTVGTVSSMSTESSDATQECQATVSSVSTESSDPTKECESTVSSVSTESSDATQECQSTLASASMPSMPVPTETIKSKGKAGKVTSSPGGSKKFVRAWLNQFSWLKFNTALNLMSCTLCIKYKQETIFTSATQNFRYV